MTTKQEIVTKKQIAEMQHEVAALERRKRELSNVRSEESAVRGSRIEMAWLGLLAFVGACGFVLMAMLTIYLSSLLWDWTVALWA